MVYETIHLHEGFVEASIVTSVHALLSSFCEVGSALVMYHLKLGLEVAAAAMEGGFLHRTGWLSQMGLCIDLFLTSVSCISSLASSNHSLSPLVENPRTSLDVCKLGDCS